MKGFKAYDIRGIYNKDFNKNDVYRVGFYLPELLKAEKVLVGRDARTSSDEIFEALCRGINDRGADVYNMGLVTTPMVYYTTAKHRFDASVQITASHNPPEYNGLKVSKTGALPVGYDSGLDELEKLVNQDKPVEKASKRGTVHDFNVQEEYISFLKKWVDFSDLSIGIDCSNGMAVLLVKDIFGTDPVYLYDTLDGTFPNHEPNPLVEKNVEDLKQLVKQHHLDIGVIFDGDADRVMFVDEKGRFISPDLMIGVLGLYFLKKEKGNVLHDIRTSRGVSEYIKNLGGTPYMWKVGHAYAKLKLRELNAIYGGELAGHYYFRDFYNCDSGMLAAILVLNVVSEMKKQGTTVSRLIEAVNPYAFSGEINFRIERKRDAMEKLKTIYTEQHAPEAVYDFDGYRIEFRDWWFNVRPSNTEPYLRLVVEGENGEILNEKTEELKKVLKEFE